MKVDITTISTSVRRSIKNFEGEKICQRTAVLLVLSVPHSDLVIDTRGVPSDECLEHVDEVSAVHELALELGHGLTVGGRAAHRLFGDLQHSGEEREIV